MTRFLPLTGLALLSACSLSGQESLEHDMSIPAVHASMQTVPVVTLDDAADDPAVWVNRADPAGSLILGTDKDAGLAIYRLDGSQLQFIEAGLPNNVDLRQEVRIGQWRGDLAAASNRADNSVTLFSIRAEGGEIIASFPTGMQEPYGSCMGMVGGQVVVFVTYKTGALQAWGLDSIAGGQAESRLLGTHQFGSQLEGCVHDDSFGMLYVGEEEFGIWRTALEAGSGDRQGAGSSTAGSGVGGTGFAEPVLIDQVDGESGTTADIEGLALYADGDRGYLIASSQGNHSYAVYERGGEHRFLTRFRIAATEDGRIDSTEETDGLEATAASLGPDYPRGVLVVQDGYNEPQGSAQNFKLVDWRDIQSLLP